MSAVNNSWRCLMCTFGQNTVNMTHCMICGAKKSNIQDWVMLPDPNTGKMYYANLKTKETRWQPPPGIAVPNTNPLAMNNHGNDILPHNDMINNNADQSVQQQMKIHGDANDHDPALNNNDCIEYNND
eukprot:440650_1